tara:strand:+ start:356 stop:790 length:435 start_codon:yes stop_codon:yes gene_type:complete
MSKSYFYNFFKIFFAILLFFIIFQANFKEAYAINTKDMQQMIVEELRLKVPTKYKDTWIKAERDIWDPWLSKQEGFLGREIFYNKDKEEALLLVSWKNKKLWKNISSEEVNYVQNIFEDNVKKSLGAESNPFELIYEGELFEQR